MRNKERRWYDLKDGKAYVYNAPYKEYAVSVSIVDVSDLRYYRNNFCLEKLWTRIH